MSRERRLAIAVNKQLAAVRDLLSVWTSITCPPSSSRQHLGEIVEGVRVSQVVQLVGDLGLQVIGVHVGVGLGGRHPGVAQQLLYRLRFGRERRAWVAKVSRSCAPLTARTARTAPPPLRSTSPGTA